VAARLAQLQGCDRATLATSTLHLFWDLFGMLAQDDIAVYIDANAYPIAHWGALHAAARGRTVLTFPHRDGAALGAMVAAREGMRPIVVADGLCVCCGMVAPFRTYHDLVRPLDGLIVLDDTQALGLLGREPTPARPYGVGGGGSAQWSGASTLSLVLVCSLAKAFGVPMAVLSGNGALVERFEATSGTRVHCSPPSTAHLHAAQRALMLNTSIGDALRGHLLRLVRLFRARLAVCGLSADGGPLPNQTLAPSPVAAAAALHSRLLAAGVRTALLGGKRGTGRLRFIITAAHRPAAIEQATSVLAELLERVPAWAPLQHHPRHAAL
jgi:8-amino-7-oxononanoate synthase